MTNNNSNGFSSSNSDDELFDNMLFEENDKQVASPSSQNSERYLVDEFIDEDGSPVKVYSEDGVHFFDQDGYAIEFLDSGEDQQNNVQEQFAEETVSEQTPHEYAQEDFVQEQYTQEPNYEAPTVNPVVEESPRFENAANDDYIYERETEETLHDVHAPTTALPQISQNMSHNDVAQQGFKPGGQTTLVDEELDSKPRFEEVITINKEKRSKRSIYFATGIFTLAIACLAYLFAPLFKSNPYYADYSGPGDGDVTVTVNKGATGEDIAKALQDQGIIKAQGSFLSAYNGDKDASRISPGEYDFKKEMKSSDALGVLLQPIKDAANSTVVSINSGFIQTDVFSELKSKMNYSDDDLNNLAKNPGQFGLPPQAKNLEGYLAPHLYVIKNGTSAKDAIQMMVDRQKKILSDDGVTDANEQYNVLTMASIAQKEGNTSDYPMITGIINNRLSPDNSETHGFLQLDSTVSYGLGKFNLTTTDDQRQDASNIYNTYVHKGLPPGPISNPSKDAIDAAKNPQKSDYYYWVTVNPVTGETKFAKTYAEHDQYAQEFVAWCNANPGKCGVDTAQNNNGQ